MTGDKAFPTDDFVTEDRSPFARRPFRILFYVVSALMAAFVVGGFFLPREVRVVRSLEISAPRESVYPHLEAFQKWDRWAPWFVQNVFLEKKLDGPEAGPGAVLTWNSREDGSGKVKIVSAIPLQRINLAVDLENIGDGISWFELSDSGNGRTTVTWGFAADAGHNYAKRYFALFFRGRIERDFDAGLATLNSLVERGRID